MKVYVVVDLTRRFEGAELGDCHVCTDQAVALGHLALMQRESPGDCEIREVEVDAQ
mgnify:CR=1 FL=1